MSDASSSESVERVRAVMEIGTRISDASDPLGQEARRSLAETISLSPSGIELALSEHLEIEPESRKLEQVVNEIDAAPCCHVVLSPSVCVAAHRAIALAVATATDVRVKPSRRDPVLAKLLVRELSRNRRFVSAGGSIATVATLEAAEGEVVHAYGTNDTMRAIATALPVGATLIGHGTGFGIALVEQNADIERAAMQVTRDVIVFDQRGCLSPRLVFVAGGLSRARAFAEAAHAAFETWEGQVERGPADQEDERGIARYIEVMRSLGDTFIGRTSIVGLDPAPESLWMGPAFRALHVLPAEPSHIERLLGSAAHLVAAVGGEAEGPLMRSVFALTPLARVSALGRMQKPAFDGPVDRRGDVWFTR